MSNGSGVAHGCGTDVGGRVAPVDVACPVDVALETPVDVASGAATPAPDPLASPTPLVVVVEIMVGGGAIGG